MEFCMKIVSFVIIHVFFLSWPVSSRYPRYRFIVSPFRWAFWDIPTYRKLLPPALSLPFIYPGMHTYVDLYETLTAFS